MMKRLMALIMGLMMLPAVRAVAATIHVPADQPTIQAGINAAVDGDTVLVAPGTYVENVSFWGKSLIVSSLSGAEVTSITAADNSIPVVKFATSEPKGAVIRGFTITGSNNTGIAGENSSPTILNNIIRNNAGTNNSNYGGGITLRGTMGAVVRGNIIHDNQSTYAPGVAIGQDGVNNLSDTICYNLLYANVGVGDIRVIGTSSNPVIYNNTVSVTTWSGILNQSDNGIVTARNNVIFFAPQFGMSGNRIVAEYNCTFSNATEYDFVPGVGNIYQDAMFRDTSTHDYRLLLGSPCINAGDPASEYNDPDGSRNDMGAIPYDPPIKIKHLLIGGDSAATNVISHAPIIEWEFDIVLGPPTQAVFEIAVGIDSDWTYSEMWNPAPFNSSDTCVVYNGSTLVDGSTYWLRLRVNNSLGWSDWKQLVFRMNSIPTIPQMRLPMADGIAPSQQPGLMIRNSTDAESDSLLYTFEVSPDNFATTVFTFTKKQDADSLTTLIVDSTLVENSQYWWRVKASDYYESSEYSPVQSFWVNSVNTAPTAVSLTQPVNTIVAPLTILRPQFVWTPATDPDPLDSITYDLLIAVDSNFMFVQQIPNLTATSHTLTSDLLWGMRYWWKVKSLDRTDAFNWSPVFTFRIMTLGDANNDGAADISDVVYLVAYIFSGGLPPNPLSAGDANCEGMVDISDVVYLIAYIFAGGLAPCSEF